MAVQVSHKKTRKTLFLFSRLGELLRPEGRGFPFHCQNVASEKALAQAEALKQQARLENLDVREIEKVKQSLKGCKTCTTGWPPEARAAGRGYTDRCIRHTVAR